MGLQSNRDFRRENMLATKNKRPQTTTQTLRSTQKKFYGKKPPYLQ